MYVILALSVVIISFAYGYCMASIIINNKYLKKIERQLKEQLDEIRKKYGNDSNTIIVLDENGIELHRYDRE